MAFDDELYLEDEEADNQACPQVEGFAFTGAEDESHNLGTFDHRAQKGNGLLEYGSHLIRSPKSYQCFQRVQSALGGSENESSIDDYVPG